jgi:hypothetical protein
LHIEQAQLLAADHLGVRTAAVRAGAFSAGGVEVVPTILAMMPNGQNSYDELRALGDGAASGLGESDLQAVGIEDAATANFKVETENAAYRTLIRRLVHDFQDVISDFVFVHTPTSFQSF